MSGESACCGEAKWVRAADLGHAEGIECTLGQCAACGRYSVHLWTPHAPAGSYVALDELVARDLAAIPAGPARKQRLRDLLDL